MRDPDVGFQGHPVAADAVEERRLFDVDHKLRDGEESCRIQPQCDARQYWARDRGILSSW